MNTHETASNRPFGRALVHALAVLATLLTLLLLYVGGSVTTYRVGMAVPDWPTTFGMNMFLYDFWNAPFGVRVEHAHRLLGSAVGLAALCLWLCLLVFQRDRALNLLGTAALVLVIVQGVLGGTRVTQVSTLLAAIHGFVGQMFFGLLCLLSATTSRAWRDGAVEVDKGGLGRLAPALLIATAAQAALGSWLRHYGPVAAFGLHSIGAVVVLGLVVWTCFRIEGGRYEQRVFVKLGRFAAALVALQVILGIGAAVYLWPFDGVPRSVTFYQAVVRTLHQTTGGLLFGTSVALWAWSRSRLQGAGAAVGSKVGTGVRVDWEGVA